MLSFFKKKKNELTFRRNVDEFWDWFQKNSVKFKNVIDDGECSTLVNATSKATNKLIPSIGWCYGPGKSEGRHALTLSPEGNRNHQLLTAYWLKQAPKIEDWDFFPAKPGGELGEGHAIHMDDFEFAVGEIWLTTEIDEKNQEIDITAWHPHFHEISEDAAMRVTFIFLDELLGEYDTENWIGAIKLNQDKLAEAIPLLELPEYIEKLKSIHDWQKYSPCDEYSVYELPAKEKNYIRSDVFIGSTCHMALLNEFLKADGLPENPLDGTHAEFVYIRFANRIVPEGQEVDFRSQIEDRINEQLEAAHAGHSFGGAQGHESVYLDFIIFDGSKSIDRACPHIALIL
jgi:hypothetical protein